MPPPVLIKRGKFANPDEEELEPLEEELELEEALLLEELELEDDLPDELEDALELLELEDELELPAPVTRKRMASNSRVPSVSRISMVLVLPVNKVALMGASSEPAGRGLAVAVVVRVARRRLFTHKLMLRVPVPAATVK